ncbi:UNVERIFIED_CONTAM: hypothetical protein BEN50_01975 [Euhalothece sp. KZN 001]
MAILYVNWTATGNNDGSSWNNAYTDLQSAIAAAQSQDEIWVAKGTYKPSDFNRSDSFTLKNQVEIYGGFDGTETERSQRNIDLNPTILSGEIGNPNTIDDNSYHVVNGSSVSDTAILDGFIIQEGNASGSSSNNTDRGAAYYSNDGSPTLRNLTVRDNQASYGGGFFLDNNSNSDLENLTFTDNTATLNGGAVLVHSSNPTFTDVTFTENSADANGGAVRVSEGSPTFEDVTFSNNEAQDGAAIYNRLSSPTFKDVTFTQNTATRNGGAMFNNGNHNNVSNATIINSTFILNEAANGGGIYNDNGRSFLTNTVFSRNTTSGNGGALYNYQNSDSTLDNVTLSGNAANSGSAIFNLGTRTDTNPSRSWTDWRYDQPQINVTNSILWGNEDDSNSGAQIVNEWRSSSTVTYSVVENGYSGTGNLDTDPQFVNPAVDDLRLSPISPVLDMGTPSELPTDSQDLDGDGDTTELLSLDIAGNPRIADISVDMGAYEGQALAPVPATPPTNIIYVDIDATGGDDGTSWTNAFDDLQEALDVAEIGDKIWVADGTYIPNALGNRSASFTLLEQVEIYGGFDGTETTLEERDFENNVTILSGEIGNPNLVTDNSYHVVVASNTTETAVLDGFTIQDGYSKGSSDSNHNRGAGLYSDNGSPTLRNLVVQNNEATYSAGFQLQGTSNAHIEDVTFTNNIATEQAGAVYVDGSKPTFKDVTFTNNTAINRDGGALLLNQSNAKFEDVTFSNNEAGRHGGAVRVHHSSPTFIEATFTENTATNTGGAIYANGTYNDLSQPTIVNSTFTLNNANEGGAIYNDNGRSFLRNVVFSRNTASGNGGALYNYQNSDADIDNVTFSGNAANSGSAIFNLGTRTDTNPSRSWTDWRYDQPQINVTNSILWGNEDDSNSGAQIVNEWRSSSTVTYSVVENGYSGTGNLDTDPLFIAPLSNDVRVEEGSPTIDAGTPSSLPTDNLDLDGDGDTSEALSVDLLGNERLTGSSVDMGAYEFGAAPVTGGENNQPPTISSATFSVDEESSLGTTVGTVVTNDLDDDPLFLSISGGNTDIDNDGTLPFSINNAGVITVTDPDDLDFETESTFALTVNVSDGRDNDSTVITVNLNDVNDGEPVVNSIENTSLAQGVTAGTVVIAADAVAVTDADTPPEDITYSFSEVPSNDAGEAFFAIDAITGEITVTAAGEAGLEFTNGTHFYKIGVTASDGTNTSTEEFFNVLTNVDTTSVDLQLKDENGNDITDNTILGDTFSLEVLVGDQRDTPAGVIAATYDLDFPAALIQNTDDFSDVANNNNLIPADLPLLGDGTLDNVNGTITELGAGSLPNADGDANGRAIGIGELATFSTLNFAVDDLATADDSTITLTLDPGQTGFNDGIYADPNQTLVFTEDLIINDAPVVDTIADTTIPEDIAAGTPVIAAADITATEDDLGNALEFTVTSPTDTDGNPLFAFFDETQDGDARFVNTAPEDSETADQSAFPLVVTPWGEAILDFETDPNSYELSVEASDGFKSSSVAESFNVDLENVSEVEIAVSDAAVTFTTPLSEHRDGIVTDPDLVRPAAPSVFELLISNTSEGDSDILSVSSLEVNATNVKIDPATVATLAEGDILLNPGENYPVKLTYTPDAAGEDFNVADGLVINSNAINDDSLAVALAGKSTYNSDINYDGEVNLNDLAVLEQTPFLSSLGESGYDPTADVNGDGEINRGEIIPLNFELFETIL